MAQGDTYTAREAFTFTYKGPRRKCTVRAKAGDRFWQTSTESERKAFGWVRLARKGKGSIGTGYVFSTDAVERLFDRA